jgi:hypothetical protein
MNDQIERRLDAESASESQGYVGDGRVGRAQAEPNGQVVKQGQGPTRWFRSPAEIDVGPLASVKDLLAIARSEER